jgi:hypothetical protein
MATPTNTGPKATPSPASDKPATPAPNGAVPPSPESTPDVTPAPARSGKPTRSPVPVKASEIPAAQRGGDWLDDVEFLKQHPGEYFVFEAVGASTVTYLRSTFGLDAKGRNTRTVDANGNKVKAGEKGRKVVDIYVAYVPDMVDDIKAGRIGRRKPTSN